MNMVTIPGSDTVQLKFMIRHPSYGGRMPSPRNVLAPLEAEYRKLQKLRERVRKAEAAAAKAASIAR